MTSVRCQRTCYAANNCLNTCSSQGFWFTGGVLSLLLYGQYLCSEIKPIGSPSTTAATLCPLSDQRKLTSGSSLILEGFKFSNTHEPSCFLRQAFALLFMSEAWRL